MSNLKATQDATWQHFCAEHLARSLASRSELEQAALRELADGLAAAPPAPRHFDANLLLPEWLHDGDRAPFWSWVDGRRAEFQGLLADATPTDHAQRLAAIRRVMQAQQIDVWLVPRSDPYLNEYTPIGDERLWWLTGFSGSSGMAAVLQDRAALVTDGRYTLQAAAQVDANAYQLVNSGEQTVREWLKSLKLPAGCRVACNASIYSAQSCQSWADFCAEQGWVWQAIPHDLSDHLWIDQPPAPLSPILPLRLELTGQSTADKLDHLRQQLVASKQAATLIATADSVAWVLNLRGADVPCCPLPLSRLLVTVSAYAPVYWLVDRRKLTPQAVAALPEAVVVADPDQLHGLLQQLRPAQQPSMAIDLESTTQALVSAVETAGWAVKAGQDPTLLPRACKNAVEVAAMRSAHVRDAVALVKFFCWLEHRLGDTTLPPPSEVAAVERLLEFRGEDPDFVGESFRTISGAGAHGAIMHYRATAASAAPLLQGQLYLLDSGGQYWDGTTDVTRTVLSGGTPSLEQCRHFTLVLRGHIALAMAKFPNSTTGGALEVLARHALWQNGLDFAHSTGHGVGHFLNVHEGPQGIAQGSRGRVPLQPGMVLSNEPGFYLEGSYGIRIESLMVVQPDAAHPNYLGFETLTLVPIDRRLILTDLLSAAERDWLNAYHARTQQTLLATERLSVDEAQWLQAATAPL
jgi:Xaa-Pro aminopeptidase